MIQLGDPIEEVAVFHAGTTPAGDQTLTSGGRVLCVTALGASVARARGLAYAAIEQIDFAGMQYRKDIGHRALHEPAHPEGSDPSRQHS
jgi:phosphoribosylamine--glycine ligase